MLHDLVPGGEVSILLRSAAVAGCNVEVLDVSTSVPADWNSIPTFLEPIRRFPRAPATEAVLALGRRVYERAVLDELAADTRHVELERAQKLEGHATLELGRRAGPPLARHPVLDALEQDETARSRRRLVRPEQPGHRHRQAATFLERGLAWVGGSGRVVPLHVCPHRAVPAPPQGIHQKRARVQSATTPKSDREARPWDRCIEPRDTSTSFAGAR